MLVLFVEMRRLFPILSAALLLFATVGRCDVAPSDLRGIYLRFPGTRRFTFCSGDLHLESDGLTMLNMKIRNSKIHKDTNPCSESLPHQMRRVVKPEGSKYGRLIYTSSVTFSCDRNRKNTTVTVFRPEHQFVEGVPFGPGFVYVNMTDGYRQCVWRRDGEIQSEESRHSQGQGKRGVESPNKQEAEGGSRNLWEWLGPVLGAAATIIAAVFTVYLSREYWRRKFGREDRGINIDESYMPEKPPATQANYTADTPF